MASHHDYKQEALPWVTKKSLPSGSSSHVCSSNRCLTYRDWHTDEHQSDRVAQHVVELAPQRGNRVDQSAGDGGHRRGSLGLSEGPVRGEEDVVEVVWTDNPSTSMGMADVAGHSLLCLPAWLRRCLDAQRTMRLMKRWQS